MQRSLFWGLEGDRGTQALLYFTLLSSFSILAIIISRDTSDVFVINVKTAELTGRKKNPVFM